VNNSNPKNDNAKTTVITAVNNNNVTALVQPAVYRELNTDEEQEGKTVYIGSMEIKKDKINSLFKKAKKLFGKKQNDDGPAKENGISSSTRTLR
jgi:transcription elongation GreA/GreB family factor